MMLNATANWPLCSQEPPLIHCAAQRNKGSLPPLDRLQHDRDAGAVPPEGTAQSRHPTTNLVAAAAARTADGVDGSCSNRRRDAQ